MDHQKDHPGPEVDHPVKTTLDAVHIWPMKTAQQTLSALAVAALVCVAGSACSSPVPDKAAGSYEVPQFSPDALPPEVVSAVAEQVDKALESPALDSAAEPLHSISEWDGIAREKACKYAAAAAGSGEIAGTALPSEVRNAATKVLEFC